jgi:hypothetical protein
VLFGALGVGSLQRVGHNGRLRARWARLQDGCGIVRLGILGERRRSEDVYRDAAEVRRLNWSVVQRTVLGAPPRGGGNESRQNHGWAQQSLPGLHPRHPTNALTLAYHVRSTLYFTCPVRCTVDTTVRIEAH